MWKDHNNDPSQHDKTKFKSTRRHVIIGIGHGDYYCQKKIHYPTHEMKSIDYQYFDYMNNAAISFPTSDQMYVVDKTMPIGEGAFGKVFRGELKDNPNPAKKIAIKSLAVRKNRDFGIQQDAYREINILNELKHDNIVALEKVFVSPKDGEIQLVYDYADWPLSEIIAHHKPGNAEHQYCEMKVIKSITYQIFMGLKFLHENWIMHRDIKPANILIMGVGQSQPGRVKIADFGLARIFQSPLRKLADDGDVVTIWYRAPELLLGSKHYNRAIDIWAAGCILGELLLSQPLFPGKDEQKAAGKFRDDQCRKIFQVLGKPTEQQW
jgi:cyclin-dependent kinase 8/11